MNDRILVSQIASYVVLKENRFYVEKNKFENLEQKWKTQLAQIDFGKAFEDSLK